MSITKELMKLLFIGLPLALTIYIGLHIGLLFYIIYKNQMKEDPIVKQVIEKFSTRSSVGIHKYGTTLDENKATLVEWLTHLQEELMDATLYIQKLKSDLDK